MEVNTLSEAPGRNTWQITMTYQTEGQSFEIPLRIAAKLRREIVVEPAAVMIMANAAISNEIQVTDLRAQPLSIKDVSTSAAGLKAHWEGESRDASGHRIQKIQLQLSGDFPEGRHNEILSIYTNDPAYREIKVPVTIVKHANQRLNATPGQVELLAPKGQPVPSRIVLVRDNESQEVVVDAIVPDNPAITCQWAKGPGNMATVKISGDRNLVPKEGLQGAVQVDVTKPVKQTLTIPVRITLQ
jgi:hypothetical protein